MISATDLKNGTTFVMDGNPYKVVKYAHQKIGRGGATVKLSVRNLKTGNLEEKTLNSNYKVDNIDTVKKPLQFLYSDDQTVTFMDPSTYEQTELSRLLIKSELKFIKEGDTVDILFWDNQPLSVDIAPKVTLEVTETPPGVKGDTATNVYKSAILENGLVVKVPLFIKVGDKIRVDTRSGDYIERVKS
jgi:elongation factor P